MIRVLHIIGSAVDATVEQWLRFVDWCAWRWRAWDASDAAVDEALYWDRVAAEAHHRAAQYRNQAAIVRDAKLRVRFHNPKGF